MTIGVVVVGLGQIGMTSDFALDANVHVQTHARAFHQHPSFELLAGVDSCVQRREEFSQAYGRPAFATVSEVLQSIDPALVALAVPTEAHGSVLEEVLASHRPAAILCEKPLSYNLGEAARIVASCAQTGTQLFVNYVRRADPAVHEIKARLDSGQIALPLKGVAWYSKGLFNNGSHFLDLLQYWLGEWQGFKLVQTGRCWGDDPEPDFLATFVGGQIQFLAAREEDYSHYTVELVSPSGRLRYDLGGSRVLWQAAIPSVTSLDYTVLNPAQQEIPNDLAKIQWHMANQLAAALSGRPTAICTGAQALRTIEHLTSIKNAL
ncbi:Gfo/Idh/MocA family protein [Pollutimonas sp. M17]|uniref:Gfo/Idh/MocA family protein n=1 Tax=Pollutimonas sp. M17 TaxID=2962065 RepID=UPI0021F45232|nr:Gfo/Idh/MocA family oxidoreductase [Pollutimonas sp. M17]UYO93975.1 Gfo/Idh/MocA family oxidoreductase [Pollutimonas sp. M17]